MDAIRARLAGALGIGVDAVSVKGKTNEGMGEAGRGEGIFVHAVALLRELVGSASTQAFDRLLTTNY